MICLEQIPSRFHRVVLLVVVLLLPTLSIASGDRSSGASTPPPPPPYPPPPANPNPQQWYSVGGYSPSSPPQVVRGSQIQKWQKSGVVTPSQIRTPSTPLPKSSPAQLPQIARTASFVHLFRIMSLYYLGNQAYQVLYAAAVSSSATATATSQILNIPSLSNFISSLSQTLSTPSPQKVCLVSLMLFTVTCTELYNFSRLNNVSTTLKTLNALTSQSFNLPRSNVNTLLKILILTITVFNPNYTTLHKYTRSLFSHSFLSRIKVAVPIASVTLKGMTLDKIKMARDDIDLNKIMKTMKEIRIKSSLDAILSSAKSTASRISSTASTTSSSILSNHPNLNVDLLKHLTYNTLVILSTFLISFTLISLISTRYNSGTMQPSPEPEQSKAKIQKLEKYTLSKSSNQKWISDNFAYVASTLINPEPAHPAANSRSRSTPPGIVSTILMYSNVVNWKLIVKNLMLIEVHVLPLVVLFHVSNLSAFNKILTTYLTAWHLYYSSLSFTKLRALNQVIGGLNSKIKSDQQANMDGKVEADIRVEDYWVARNNKWVVPGLSLSLDAGKVTVIKGYGGREAIRCILNKDEGDKQVVRGGVTGEKVVKWFDRSKEEEWMGVAHARGNGNEGPAYAVAGKICQEECFRNFLSRICRFKEVEDTLKGYLIVVDGEALNEKVLTMLRKAGASVVMFEGNGDDVLDMDYFWDGV
ncbi:hypothetical protein TrST_g6036 [Triparma strigata]|uniref:Uncharacterized protein n=1 Tax=Triparma strigata TaxID=1606541 RepID=A0A9W7EA63_9STRA|nr:hypothetical protein TrST_g6036 [Triparma strigata]